MDEAGRSLKTGESAQSTPPHLTGRQHIVTYPVGDRHGNKALSDAKRGNHPRITDRSSRVARKFKSTRPPTFLLSEGFADACNGRGYNQYFVLRPSLIHLDFTELLTKLHLSCRNTANPFHHSPPRVLRRPGFRVCPILCFSSDRFRDCR